MHQARGAQARGPLDSVHQGRAAYARGPLGNVTQARAAYTSAAQVGDRSATGDNWQPARGQAALSSQARALSFVISSSLCPSAPDLSTCVGSTTSVRFSVSPLQTVEAAHVHAAQEPGDSERSAAPRLPAP